MSDLSVELPALVGAAHAAADIECELADALAQLHRRADVLLDRWRGIASNTVERAWSQWHGSATAVLGDLARLREALGTAEHDYLQRDHAESDRFRLVLS